VKRAGRKSREAQIAIAVGKETSYFPSGDRLEYMRFQLSVD